MGDPVIRLQSLKVVVVNWPIMKRVTCQQLLRDIHLSGPDLYQGFLFHCMCEEQMVLNGYPVLDKKDPTRAMLYSFRYPEVTRCRCGKKVDMTDKDWYRDEEGCRYHWGKLNYEGGQMHGLYTCCQTRPGGDACAFSPAHVSFHRPFKDLEFKHCLYKSQCSPSNVFAVDCEMAFTTHGLELVRVSLVGLMGNIIYDTYVKPDHLLLDANTNFSGVTADQLNRESTTLADVQKHLLQILNSDSILIGHSVQSDLLALHLVHERIVDTSVVFPHPRGFPLKNSLKYLAKTILHKDIQTRGHDSVEDARSCMELMLWKIRQDTRLFCPMRYYVCPVLCVNVPLYVPPPLFMPPPTHAHLRPFIKHLM